ncbi:Uncharacterized protein AB751O23_AA_00080 [Chlamydiales bacterium SCGC AB-751-O23]|jgi:hypothetical protein|nr:Uncharacterized protein AB751O23_AA_00080 [Chlamydiales bacterium SCGC AB-751-O23]
MDSLFKLYPVLKNEFNAVYTKNGLILSNLILDQESQKYSSCSFNIDSLRAQFRTGYITPKKAGLFVTLWKRQKGSIIQPFDRSDDIIFFVASVRKENFHGQFVFSKSILLKKGILSENNKGGKLAFRIYPPWEKDLNSQAKKTQLWQLPYFLEILNTTILDHEHLKNLYKDSSL